MSDAAIAAPRVEAQGYRFAVSETIKHAVLIVGALIVLFPFYVMISLSLKSPPEILQNIGGFFGSQEAFIDDACLIVGGTEEECLKNPVVYNYTTAFEKAPLVRYMLNGVIVTA
ncbi:MAG: carbohydrate ABC transporter permease, partial [Pseudomonadota bacterium]